MKYSVMESASSRVVNAMVVIARDREESGRRVGRGRLRYRKLK